MAAGIDRGRHRRGGTGDRNALGAAAAVCRRARATAFATDHATSRAAFQVPRWLPPVVADRPVVCYRKLDDAGDKLLTCPGQSYWRAGLLPFPTSVAIRMLVANRACISLTARSCQISPDLVNQIDGAEVWATEASWRHRQPAPEGVADAGKRFSGACPVRPLYGGPGRP